MSERPRLTYSELGEECIRLYGAIDLMKAQVARAEATAERETVERQRLARVLDLLRHVVVSHRMKFGFNSEDTAIIDEALDFDGRGEFRLPEFDGRYPGEDDSETGGF